ncbi:MAG TPA: DUF1800 domain-containing protein [Steroidobacteraceae bacterium]|nr:DUF1800 domain-containing protein [Steroidobacteraceae bacterium]
MRQTDAAVAANRFGLGAKPGQLGTQGSDARDALRAQLEGPAPLIGATLPASHSVVAAAQARRDNAAGANAQVRPGADVVNAAQTVREIYAPAHAAEMLARYRHAVATERSFVERLVHFWSNHFAVSVDKLAVLGLAGAMEREAIRPHVLGNFADLLLAVEQHPAMLLYLDNQQSMGPNSTAARQADRRGRELGLNENLGREILELHTLGVGGGYSQQDVRALATIISGWSVGGGQGRQRGGEPGRFHFRAAFHEPGAQVLLGKRHADDGVRQGERALRDLALQPATARHLATKLVRHLVADDPPAALVEQVAAAYLRADGDLPSTYRALLAAEQSWEQPLAKFKTPSDYIHSAWRALELPVAPRDPRLFEQLGQPQLRPGSPAGWPDRSADWDSGAALMKRLEWAQEQGAMLGSRRNARQVAAACLGAVWSPASDQAVARAQDATQALALLLAAPEFMRR